jgi:hypothetical protein
MVSLRLLCLTSTILGAIKADDRKCVDCDEIGELVNSENCVEVLRGWKRQGLDMRLAVSPPLGSGQGWQA